MRSSNVEVKVGGYVGSPPNKGVETATAFTKGPRHENIRFGGAAGNILEFGGCS